MFIAIKENELIIREPNMVQMLELYQWVLFLVHVHDLYAFHQLYNLCGLPKQTNHSDTITELPI